MKVSLFNVNDLHYAYVNGEEFVSEHWLVSLMQATWNWKFPRRRRSRIIRTVIWLVRAGLKLKMKMKLKIKRKEKRVRICAWCRKPLDMSSRVRMNWVPEREWSHGMCKDCYEQMFREKANRTEKYEFTPENAL